MVEKELHDLIKQIQARGCEEQTTEVKAAHGGCPEKLYDTISSFSNQNSGGTFVFGLDEMNGFKQRRAGPSPQARIESSRADQREAFPPQEAPLRLVFLAAV